MPDTTTLTMFWVYVLESAKDGKRYIGFTGNIKKRLKEHQQGLSFSTKYRLPMKPIYLEACLNEEDAKRREYYFKNTGGRKFLAKRLKSYYQFKSKL